MTDEIVVQRQEMSNYSLQKALLGIAADFKYAFENNDVGLAYRTIEGDLATAYVFAKELEERGYDAFCELVDQYNKGESA